MTALQKRLFSNSLFSFSATAVLLVALALLSGCASGPAPLPPTPVVTIEDGVFIDGVVSLDGRGYGGATVELYPFDAFNAGMPSPEPTATTTSDRVGRFLVEVPSGRYLLMAHTETHFSYFGRNPLNAKANQRSTSLPLMLRPQLETSNVEAGTESLSGRVLYKGQPVGGAVVSLYLEADKGFRGPPYQAATFTQADGHYEMTVEPGRYFMVARQRKTIATKGPMSPGDMFGVHPVMPLKISSGTAMTTDISVVELPSQERMSRFLSRFATLEGIVVDEAGEPVAGLRPCLYDNPRLLNEPVEIGAKSGSDGRFTLKTTHSGHFHLGARAALGGPPVSGEQVGYAENSPAEGIKLEPGKVIIGLRIVVRVTP